MNKNPIGVFDSGIGGISVLEQCIKKLPYENFIYLSDCKFAPYGTKPVNEILERIYICSEILFSMKCKAVVVACNTATGVGIEQLRNKYSQPFIGLEPALKPAYNTPGDGKVLVLCTIATANQPKFKQLLSKFDNDKIIVVPQKKLATLIENNILTLENIREDIYKILEPYKNIKSIVLGCTHYVFVKNIIGDFYGETVKIFDGNEGAANRLSDVLKEKNLLNKSKIKGKVFFEFT